MKIRYFVEIKDPETHLVNVKITGKREKGQDNLSFFLPSWSPGSYLMREYSRNIRTIKASGKKGEDLFLRQVTKNEYLLDFNHHDFKSDTEEFNLHYTIYCHELTVRTSHVDYSHAFLHGPSYLMGIKDKELIEPEIEFKFPGLWSKLHTSMEDISQERERFIYKAPTYDDLIDCPVEIGCHESDGFMVDGKEHHLVWYGDEYPHKNDLKKDIKIIVEHVSSTMEEIPYDQYMFITHFSPNLYGGLEHKNSTALHFDGRKLKDRSTYVNWLALVAHEYFHTWNVKRIRPIELGPFDYQNENYTRMHWLTEGLTSFMDELFVYRSGLCTLQEYLDMQKKNLARYFSIPGKKFHSLEDSSFNAWIKLYRPDENSNNSSISYYLKGGLVFSTLHFELKKQGKDINDLLHLLWKRYKDDPKTGVNHEEVMKMVEYLGGRSIREQFELRLSTTEDIDFESYYKDIGLEFVYDESEKVDLGVTFKFTGERVFISTVTLDGPAYKAGLNAGDEIIAVNRLRFMKSDANDLDKILINGKNYEFTISRLNKLHTIEIAPEKKPKTLKEIRVIDGDRAAKAFS